MGRNRGAYKRDRRESEATAKRKESYIGPDELRQLENKNFTRFYQGAVVPESEWDACIDSFRTSLPSSFRVNTSLPTAPAVRDLLIRAMAAQQEGLCTPIAFIPDAMAHQINASRGEIKRDGALKHLKKLMNVLSEEGYLSRQEAVSMIPPLLLDVGPGHRVIDMCAAPGSKTTQILEYLVGHGPGGAVVANDVNQGRLDVLNHQTARLPDAKSRLIITNHDATAFPLVTSSEHKFDRVLCDVMCSGDGTLRKSIDLWARWTPLMGPHLHFQQARVLKRGMGLCKAGGIVVYSTCSMNPAEDEAVIASCLLEADGAFELIDPGVALPGLIHYEGMHTWRLLSPDGSTELFDAGDAGRLTLKKHGGNGGNGAAAAADANTEAGPAPADGDATDAAATADAGAEAAGAKPRRGGNTAKFTFTASMFPPPPETAAKLRLERCVRVAPHQQDTGGFFIAGLRCLRELPGSVASGYRRKYVNDMQPVSAEILRLIQTNIRLPAGFPTNRLYCVHEAARMPKVYYLSEDCAALAENLNAKVVQCGVKAFESNVKKSWAHCRITTDGAATIAPLLGAGLVVHTTAAQLHAVVEAAGEAALKSRQVAMTAEEFVERLCPTAAPATLPPCGVLVVDCGETLGRAYVPFDNFHNVAVRFAATVPGLLRVAVGAPLISAAEADDGDDGSSSAGEDGADADGVGAAPEQPPAE